MAMVAWKLTGGSGPFNPCCHAGAPGRFLLLSAKAQRRLLPRLATALRPGRRLLFTTPAQRAERRDLLTGRVSLSLGAQEYGSLLKQAGFVLEDAPVDEGGNQHYACLLRATAASRPSR